MAADCHHHKTPTRAEIFYKAHRKHPPLFQGEFLDSWLHPDVVEIVQSCKHAYLKQAEYDSADNDGNTSLSQDAKWISKISPKLKVETSDVYSFCCLSEEFLRMINEELANFYALTDKYHIPVRRPNSMNNYGVVLNEIGMRPMITAFQQQVIWPVARVLFPIQGQKFDNHHSFIVRYQADEDLGLDMHVDDSDVTFNVCLGERGFEGATLVFCGTMGQSNQRQFSHTYHHEIGRAILHLGNRRHGAEDIEKGTRINWIVWNHNLQYRQSENYRRRWGALDYEKEEGPPSKVCLSYTHDKDYTHFHGTLPKAAQDQHLHPWCPPPGKEYDGYGTNGTDHSRPEEN